MDTLDTYEYRLQGRRPGTYAALGFGMTMAYVSLHNDASAMAWALVSVFLALVLGALALNRAAGLRLGSERFEVYAGPERRVIAVSSIVGADLYARRCGARHCLLRLADGGQMALPHSALPPVRRLAEELQRRSVPTRILIAVRPRSQAATSDVRAEHRHGGVAPAAYSGSGRSALFQTLP